MADEREIFKRALAGTGECPELPALLDGVERGNAAAERHAEECPRCKAEVALYRHVNSGPAIEGADMQSLNRHISLTITKTARATSEKWWKQLFRPVILTPVAVALAMLMLVVNIDTHRTGTTAIDVERSQAVQLIAPAGEITDAPTTLRWAEVARASSYRVRVLEVDRNILWEASANATSVAVPAAIKKQALPGKRLIWTVDALSNSGTVIASGTQDFRRMLVRKDAK